MNVLNHPICFVLFFLIFSHFSTSLSSFTYKTVSLGSAVSRTCWGKYHLPLFFISCRYPTILFSHIYKSLFVRLSGFTCGGNMERERVERKIIVNHPPYPICVFLYFLSFSTHPPSHTYKASSLESVVACGGKYRKRKRG